MATDTFTHNFDIDLIEVKLKGECEFNNDGKASFKITQSSDSIPIEFMDWFYQFMKFAEETYHLEGVTGFIKISIKKKE